MTEQEAFEAIEAVVNGYAFPEAERTEWVLVAIGGDESESGLIGNVHDVRTLSTPHYDQDAKHVLEDGIKSLATEGVQLLSC